jgi:hypothetical protein
MAHGQGLRRIRNQTHRLIRLERERERERELEWWNSGIVQTNPINIIIHYYLHHWLIGYSSSSLFNFDPLCPCILEYQVSTHIAINTGEYFTLIIKESNIMSLNS